MEGRFVDTVWGEITPNYDCTQGAKDKGGVPGFWGSAAWLRRFFRTSIGGSGLRKREGFFFFLMMMMIIIIAPENKKPG